jgi:predicted dehydrogenase
MSRKENSMIETAVIGVGNMGSKYAAIIQDKHIDGLELSALTRIREPYRSLLQKSVDSGVPVFESADTLFDAVENGSLKIDAVIIATPHFSHEELAIRAFKNGLHVLCDKPSGVYSRQARLMEEAADRSGKVFSMVFNQRTLPIHKQLKEIVSSGRYGALKRVNWVVTDWYRPEQYYKSSSWHATWDKDGGGVLLNQCPHNLDLLQWICGNPARVQGFCHEGRFHDIEVEDDVTAYLEWENGATGTFITSTGDAPGINRLEISLEEALIVCENGMIRIGELAQEMGGKEADYRSKSTDFFRKIKGTWIEIKPEKEDHPYEKVIQGFVDEINGSGKSIADGREGRKSLLISNAIYLSSWEKRMEDIPQIGSAEEIDFEQRFEATFKKKIKKTR